MQNTATATRRRAARSRSTTSSPWSSGGDNTLANLWPEHARPRPGFREKDEVENLLHAEVCSGRMSAAAAQRAIAENWLAVWRTIERAVAERRSRRDD